MGRIKIPIGVIIFVGIWLVALCVPTVRELPTTLAFYEMFRPQTYFNTPGGREFARRYPDNPTAALWGAEDEWRGYNADLDTGEPIFGGDKTALKRVAARFPNDLQIRALQLRTFSEGWSGMKDDRIKSDSKLQARWIEAAQIAREGAQSEPDNVFWPWMEAGFEFASNRDDAALRAFERAGKCTRYDDYVTATLMARLNFWKSVENPSWEQKVALWASTLFSHMAPMNDSVSFATKRASALRKSGETERAFAIEADVLTAARLLRQNANVMITALVAEDMGNKSLEEFTGIARPKENFGAQNFEQHSTKLSQAWAELARQNGQGALAARADWMREPSARSLYRFEDITLDIAGMRAPWGIMAVLAPIVLQALGLVVIAGALLWLGGRWLRFEDAIPTRGQVVGCANFSFWLMIGIVAVVVALSWRAYWFSFDLGQGKAVFVAFGFALITVVCWLSPVWFIGLKVSRRWSRTRPANSRPLPVGINVARKVSWLVFGVALILTLTDGRGLWDGTWFQLSNSALVADIALIVVLVTEFIRWQRAGWQLKLVAREGVVAPKPASIGPKRWAPYGLLLLCGALLAPVAMNVVNGLPYSESMIPLFFVGIAAIAALVSSWRLSSNHFTWQLAHRSAGVLVVVWSSMFLLVAVGAWPLRAELNRNLERRISIGEIAWAREQGAKLK